MKIPKLDRFRIALGAGILLVVIVVGGIGWAFYQQLTLAGELREETRRLEQAVATQTAHREHLTATLTYVQTDAYAEAWAREEAKMAKPGEVVLIPVVKAGEAPSPSSTEPEGSAPSRAAPKPFWVRWWEAIFGP